LRHQILSSEAWTAELGDAHNIGSSQQLTSIGQHALACDDLFRDLLSRETSVRQQSHDTVTRDDVLREYERYILWASNIGVFAEAQSSLDFRLRGLDDSTDDFLAQLSLIRSRLLRLSRLPLFCTESPPDAPMEAFSDLDHDESSAITRQPTVEDLSWRLPSAITDAANAVEKEQGQHVDPYSDRKPDDLNVPPTWTWTTARVLQSVRRSIDWLHRLSNLVKKASFATQNRRAKDYEFDGEEFRVEGLRDFYSWFLTRQYDGLHQSLRHRIVESMVLRRKLCHYRQKQRPMCIPSVRSRDGKIKLNAATKSDDSLQAVPSEPTVRPSSLSTDLASPAENTEATMSRISAPTIEDELLRTTTIPSRISRTSPMGEHSQAFIPTPPAKVFSQEIFTCIYCHLVLPSALARDTVSWA